MQQSQTEQYQRLFEQVPIGLYVSSPDGRLLDANPALLTMLGYPSLEAFTEVPAEQLYLDPEDRRRWQAMIEGSGVVRDCEFRLRRADGALIWVTDNGHAVRDDAGRIIYYEGSLQDITDRKRAEDAIHHSESLFRTLFELSPDAIVLIDPHDASVSWPIVDCNDAACRVNGYRREELIGRSIDILNEKPGPPAERDDYLARLRREGAFKGEVIHRRKSGALFPVMFATSVITVGDRELVLGIDRDISDIKRSQQALEAQRRELHMVISSMPNLLIKLDDRDRLSAFAAPPRFARFLKTTDEPVGRPIAEMLPPGAPNQILEAVTRARETGQEDAIEYSSPVDGQTAYYEIKVSPVGDSREVLVVADNITERKLAELAEHDQRILAEALRDIAILLNSTLDLTEVLDRILANLERVVRYDAANIMMVDGDMARVVGSRGYGEGERGTPPTALRRSLAEMSTLRTMFGSGRSLLIPSTRRHLEWMIDSDSAWIKSYAGAPIRVQDQTIGFINLDSAAEDFFTQDHLDRLEAFAAQAAVAIQNAQLYQTLHEQTVELGIANRELEAFSHTVAHDLKAPLQVVIGYTSLLQQLYEDALDEEGRQMVEEMKTASFRMGGMIESLLLLAKLRHVEEKLTTVDMVPVAEAARDRFKNLIAERGVRVEIAAEMPQAVGYGPWLEEVFANLISNAIKYIGQDNAAPRIVVRGTRLGDLVRYDVEDNGLGISDQDQARLFEMFSRFHKNEASGLGLGLSIVQRIVTRLNGQLGVESTPGHGSTFWFALPALSAAPGA